MSFGRLLRAAPVFAAGWANLNGLWEWERAAPGNHTAGTFNETPPFGRTLKGSILVPFPVEACLSGVAPLLGNHTGGYSGFSFDVTDLLTDTGNELLLHPEGKQKQGALSNPGWPPLNFPNGTHSPWGALWGIVYTPSSGIWQTVWLESVPKAYIDAVTIDQASETTPNSTQCGGPDTVCWLKGGPVPVNPQSNASCRDSQLFARMGAAKPLLNGERTFLTGTLDQSWWPDGEYTAPSDEALESDLIATRKIGFNVIRLHQKVNPERWYYHADRHGVAVFQDVPEKYGGGTNETWEPFNEGDMFELFNDTTSFATIVALIKSRGRARSARLRRLT
eukprot:gene24507-6500_t